MTPHSRIRVLNQDAPRRAGSFVLYWMIAARRTTWNYGLDRAVELAEELDRPLLVLEALRCDSKHASARTHAFILQGMVENARAFARAGVAYHPFVETKVGEGKGLLLELAKSACAVITDEYPHHFLPRMVGAAADRVPVRMEAVDSNGILPLAAPERVYGRAYDFRRFLHRELPLHLEAPPRRDPLARARLRRLPRIPTRIEKRWPRASEELLTGRPSALAALPIDQEVVPVDLTGGAEAGRKVLARFLSDRIEHYDDASRHPDGAGTSRLSPYLHFGHLSAHEVLHRAVRQGGASRPRLVTTEGDKPLTSWGLSAPAESFVDELITWRELCYHTAAHVEGHDEWNSLPPWARETLLDHAGDERPHLYARAAFEEAATHDPIWNAAQRELRATGRIHSYLRMLWGKKILHWTADPREALALAAELNDRWALDGRDPNSTGGVFWIFGRYDRAWGPERPVFGRVRYMSSANTRKKLRLGDYLERWGAPSALNPCATGPRG